MTTQRNSKREWQRKLRELFPSDHYSLRYVAWFNKNFSTSFKSAQLLILFKRLQGPVTM